MLTKLEKLREINKLINNVLSELETKLFIVNDNNDINKTREKYIKPLC